MTDGAWHKEFVKCVMDATHCTHEQARVVLGEVIELRETSYQQGFSRGLEVTACIQPIEVFTDKVHQPGRID